MLDDTEWVQVARFDDPVAAEIATNFLRDHGVTVALRGNSGSTSVLNRFDTVMDIRLVVPDYEERTAREVLAAMDVANADGVAGAADGAGEESGGGPYRAVPLRTDGQPSAPRRRMALAPLVLAMVIPGGGHFYARHTRAGAVLCAGVVAFFVAGMARGKSDALLAAVLIVAADAVLGVAAVARCNAGRVPPPRQQTVAAVAVVLGACVTALLLSRA